MNFKLILQYLLIYSILATISILIALSFWWTDGLTLSSLNKQSLAIIGSVGVMWIAIIFLSILIIRVVLLRGYDGFISPLTLSDQNFITEIGLAKAKKMKLSLTLLAFGLLFISIFVFRYVMSVHKEHEFQYNSETQIVVVNEILYDIKKNPYAHFIYDYNGKSYETNLPLNRLTKGDSAKIVFSKGNPAIVDYR